MRAAATAAKTAMSVDPGINSFFLKLIMHLKHFFPTWHTNPNAHNRLRFFRGPELLLGTNSISLRSTPYRSAGIGRRRRPPSVGRADGKYAERRLGPKERMPRHTRFWTGGKNGARARPRRVQSRVTRYVIKIGEKKPDYWCKNKSSKVYGHI